MKNIFHGTKTYTALLAILLIGLKISTLYPKKQEIVPNNTPQQEEVWVNVFVHGIMSIAPHVSWNNFMKFVKDDVDGTHYSKTVELMREDPFFYKNQAMQQIGFHQVDVTNTTGNSSASLAYIINEINEQYGLKKVSHYYTFGWSGLLSQKHRYIDAKQLFQSLNKEIALLKRQYKNPLIKIRLIGYSHGGNVLLNLALVRKKEFPKTRLHIDELVLLGTPIINDTDHLINDPMFNKIFNLYSLNDKIQPLDLFAPNQLFSQRTFKARKGFTLPNKLIQIQLKVTRCKNNVRETPRKLELSKDLTKRSVVFGKRGLLRDISPGHFELWFFGWTPVRYRDHYPMYPLPTVSLVPVLTYHADKIASSLSPGTAVIADIRPEHNVILFRSQNKYRVHSTIPYIPPKKLSELKQTVLQHKPTLYTDEIYDAHVEDAVRNAQQIMESYRKN